MTYRTFNVTHSKADGFQLHLLERSSFRDWVYNVAEGFEAHVLRHRFCNSWIVNAPMNWADSREKVLAITSIDREQADALAFQSDTWSYLDEPPMTDEEVRDFTERMNKMVEEWDALPWYKRAWFTLFPSKDNSSE